MSALSEKASAVAASPGAPALTGRLGPVSIVFMVVAAAAPLTVVGGGAPLGFLLGNGPGFPSLYAVCGVVLLLFSVGLAAMTRSVPRPGGFFTFIGHGLGRPAGVASAALALLTYTTIQISVHGYIGYILSITVTGLGGPSLPWWLYSLAVIGAVGLLGYRHIDVSSKVLGLLLIGEIGVVLVLVVAIMLRGGGNGLSLAPFTPDSVFSGSPGVGLTFAIAAFIGFEATTIFRDEARDPNRTIPRATYIAVIGIAVFYTLAGWALVMAWGPDRVVAVAAQNPGAMILTTTARYLGPVGESVLNVLLITSMFACVLSFHNVLTRYQHAMANSGLLPRMLSRVHVRHQSPHTSSTVQTLTALVLIAVFALLRLDPVLQVFTWFSGVATLAISLLMAATSVAVVVYFARRPAERHLWRTVIAPILGLVGLVGATIAIATNFPLLLGDVNGSGAPVFGPVTALFFAVVIAVPAAGLAQALVLRHRNRVVYDRVIDSLADAES